MGLHFLYTEICWESGFKKWVKFMIKVYFIYSGYLITAKIYVSFILFLQTATDHLHSARVQITREQRISDICAKKNFKNLIYIIISDRICVYIYKFVFSCTVCDIEDIGSFDI